VDKQVFLNKEELVNFYNDRYETGYMDSWPYKKIRRIKDLIKKIHIPAGGIILDYGCGTGVFTSVLKDIFPHCSVYGCDISENAILKSKAKYPECYFFLNNEYESLSFDRPFDLIFSHHVLEHIDDLEIVFNFFEKVLKKEGQMFHILPCGNDHSYESDLCKCVLNGIDNIRGRFFFEDEGHLRRLTSDQLTYLLANNGFKLKKAFFANQYFGAVRWIAETDYNYIEYLTDPGKAINDDMRKKLIRIRKELLFYHKAWRYNSFNLNELIQSKRPWLYPMKYIKRILSVLLIFFLDKMTGFEWYFTKLRKNGSEMYLLFER
jgi:ubiquinone/menaquinone biosynthesis C-methylase UbiE